MKQRLRSARGVTRRPGALRRRGPAIGLVGALICGSWTGLALTSPPSGAAAATAGTAAQPDAAGVRLDNPDPLGLSVAMSQRRFADSFAGNGGTVYVAAVESPALTATAGTLTDGPVLYTTGCGTPQDAVTAEIDRLDPSRVVALGNAAAVCPDTLDALAGDRSTGRIAAPDRLGMARAIGRARRTAGPVTQVFVVRSDDAQAAALTSGQAAGPVLLLDGRKSSRTAVRRLIRTWKPARLVAVGNKRRLPARWLQQAAGGRPISRIGAARPTGRSVALADWEYGRTANAVYAVAPGSLTDLVIAATATDGPTLVTPDSTTVPGPVADRLKSLKPPDVVAVSAPDRLSDDALAALAATVPTGSQPAVEVDEGLQVLETAERRAVLGYDARTGVLRIRRGTPAVEQLGVGDIVTSVRAPGMPEGLMRRVTAVRVEPKALVLRTVRADLDEVVTGTDGPLDLQATVLDDQVTPLRGVRLTEDGPSTRAGGADRDGFERTFSLSGKISKSTPGKGNLSGSGQIKLNGKLTVGGSATLLVEKDGPFIWKRVRQQTDLYAKPSVQLTGSGKLKGSKTWPLFKHTRFLKFAVGPVPVVVTLESQIQIKAKADVSAEWKIAGASARGDVSVGFDYNDGTTVPIFDTDGSASLGTFTAEPDVAIEATVTPGVAVKTKAYGLLGPTFDLGPFVRGKATVSGEQGFECELALGVAGEYGISAGRTMFGFDFEADYSDRSEYVLASTTKPCGDQDLITFDEFPIGTAITDQYADRGVLINGPDSPYLAVDGAQPTSPVLSPGPNYQGQVTFQIVRKQSPHEPSSAGRVTFDIGYIDEVGPTVAWFGPSGKQLGKRKIQGVGIVPVTIEDKRIRRLVIREEGDGNGVSIDNFGYTR